MESTSYWNGGNSYKLGQDDGEVLPKKADVVVIGGGYTGLSAARTLAQSNIDVVVLERNTIGWGASSRNAGMTGCGLKLGAPTIFKRYGQEIGTAFWQLSLDALELIKELVNQEGIACDWQQNGDLGVAYKASHYDDLRDRVEWHEKYLGHQLHLISPVDIQAEIGSEVYYGGVIGGHGAGLHPVKLVHGLAQKAQQYGARLFEKAGALKIEKNGSGYLLQTARGSIGADNIIVATNGYTDRLVSGLKSKIIPVGSYSIVTEPLAEELQKKISPNGRGFWDSKWFLNYFRLTPDGRMLWGGRNNLSTDLDLAQSARILQSQMVRAFPELAGIPVTHTWTGQLGLTFDLLPHIGQIDGIYYAFGYGGHGLHTALYAGREIAFLLTGHKSSSLFMEIPHQTYFFYRDKPWFMPLAVQYYRLKDWFS